MNNFQSGMMRFNWLLFLLATCSPSAASAIENRSSLECIDLRCEYRQNPLGIDEAKPRLGWKVKSKERGQRQTAYQILVASTAEHLANGQGDVWDSKKVDSNKTIQIEFGGKQLTSGQACFWKVKTWDQDGVASAWSNPASWSMGLLNESDWTAKYISVVDESPVLKNRTKLYLPPAANYRTGFAAKKPVKRAAIYATGLGIFDLELNGQRVSDEYFSPGWTDYRQRAYYKTYDVTSMLQAGENALGATVADGWYSGYVGFGLLVGIGTEQTGRYTYGKTPALMLQMEIEYADGTTARVVTDKSWKVTTAGPVRQADLLMGEFYDARQELQGWSLPGFDDSAWQSAILASESGAQPATFYEFENPEPGKGPKIKGKPVDLVFRRPRLESFPGVPVVVTEELKPISVTERAEGTYIFDLGQNFAGNVRFKVRGPAGHQITLRYAEMLHTDGRLMTENLRKARATDFYVCKGGNETETYSPRFTFHGFQFVEVSNLPEEATLDTITGLVIHSDTPMVSSFECSDPMVNQLHKNVVWTQRANFIDLPTDCPQRDERMGWTGDAQAYVGTAAYNADIGAFFTKWNRELMESQRPSGAFPGYAPYPFQHGWDFGSAWADAGIICPWTIWQVYGDTRTIDRCWEPMTKFLDWRNQTSVDDLGITHGNPWGDWLSQGETTPLNYVDSIYYAISTRMMAEMAEATGRDAEARSYRQQLEKTKAAFIRKYVNEDGSINVPTQTAQALALFADLVPQDLREGTGKKLAAMIATNGNHMATGFLGTRPLLPVLSSVGQHDLATFLLQSHEFPSWGYEIDQGATSIWERWDSFTKEDGFGRHNAAMNSFSHYAFGAVNEWMFRTLAGIDSNAPGYTEINIRPTPPNPGSNGMHQPIDSVNASYDSIRGLIRSQWKLAGDAFQLNVSIPANTTANVYLPTTDAESILESGAKLGGNPHVSVLRTENDRTILSVESGDYQFTAKSSLKSAQMAIKTSVPKDNSPNPEQVDLTDAKRIVHWDFGSASDQEKWQRSNVDIVQRDGKSFLVAAGNDSKMETVLETVLSGQLIVRISAMPSKGASSQIFWTKHGIGFNSGNQTKRQLNSTDQVNDYLFKIDATQPIGKLRFDPFENYDEHANKGEMQIESISVYQLPQPIAETPQTEETTDATSPVSIKDSTSNRKPNIVFILADDLGWSDTTLFNTTKLYETPNIERLAARGMTFTHAYAASPLCSPTRSAILTGLHPARTGLTAPNCHLPVVNLKARQGTRAAPDRKSVPVNTVSRLDPKYYTLGEALKDAGYINGHFGKWHLGHEPYSPLENGFDIDIPHTPGPGPAGSYVAPWRYPDFDPDTPNEHIEDRMAREAVKFMETNQDKPFFLNYWMFSVHAPFDAKPDLIEKYRGKIDKNDPQRSPTYAAMIESMDDAVGTLLDTLDRLEIADNTIIVFASDNGGNMYNWVDETFPTSNAPLRGGKATMFEGGVRGPCSVIWPGKISTDSRCDEVIQSCDFYPTLLEMLELKPQPEQSFDGISIMPALTGGKLDRDAIFTYFPHSPNIPEWLPPAVSVHKGDWKLIRLFQNGENGQHRWLLYNLVDDIGETNNLAEQHPERVQTLDGLIEEFLLETNAVEPIANPSFDLSKYELAKIGQAEPHGKRPNKAGKLAAPVAGWQGHGTAKLRLSGGNLLIRSSSNDPFMSFDLGQSLPAANMELRFTMSSDSSGDGEVFWASPSSSPKFSGRRSVGFSVNHDGQSHEYQIALLPKDPISEIRIDPSNGPGSSTILAAEITDVNGKSLYRWSFKEK